MPYWLMIEKIEILQHGECRNLGCHPRKEAIWLLCVIAYHHEMVILSREHRLDSLSGAFVDPGERHHLQIGEGGDNTATSDISLLVYLISCKLFAYLKNLSELCNEVYMTVTL